MSKQITVKTKMTDIDLLLSAIRSVNIFAIKKANKYGINVKRYNQSSVQADIACPKDENKKHLRWSDVGFKKNEKGYYELLIDDLDLMSFPFADIKQKYSQLKVEDNVGRMYPGALVKSFNKGDKIKLTIDI